MREVEPYLRLALPQGQWMVAVRRHLHENPEVGLELPDTHDFVRSTLIQLGLQPQTHPAAAITVRIAGSDPDEAASILRADMDALPLTEYSGVAVPSRRVGAMHA